MRIYVNKKGKPSVEFEFEDRRGGMFDSCRLNQRPEEARPSIPKGSHALIYWFLLG